MPSQKNPLQKQLEHQKFLHGASYVQNSSGGLKKLTSSELAHLNQLITGSQDEVWRLSPAEVQIPSGKKIQFNVVNNPISRARDIIGNASQMASNQKVFEAAAYIYSQLVLEHLFTDANRRTAVLATLWILSEYNQNIDVEKLLAIKIGDLRDQSSMENLAQRIQAIQD